MSKPNALLNLWSRLSFGSTGYRQYGLWKQDLLNAESSAMVEVLRRLPKKDLDERKIRIKRAMECEFKAKTLPVEEWTKEQDDKPYLTELLQEVWEEDEQRKAWRRGQAI